MGRVGRSEDAPGVVRRPPGDVPGAPGEAPGSSLGLSGEPSGVSVLSFLSFFDAKSRFRSGNGEMLENDDPLNGFAVFLRSQGLQDLVKMGAGHLKCRWAMGCGLRTME